MRISVIASASCLCLVSLVQADSAKAFIRITTNIPAEELGSALQTVAKDYDFQVLYRTELVKDLRTQGAVGSLTSDEALDKVLKGTGLTYKYLDDKTVTIVPTSTAGAAQFSTQNASSGSSDDTSASKEAGKKSSQDFRVAQVDQTNTGPQAVSNQNSGKKDEGLGEIIVTAQKREERLQDVPMSLTALSGEQLQRNQSYRLEDFVGTVPGLTVVDYGAEGSQLVIRGITSGVLAVNTSVATYIDETPYMAVGPFAGSELISPNLDTFDMQRIEVLRGPQGTLYGANALAGLVKYVTNAPDPSGFAATAETGFNSVDNGGTRLDAHAMLNIPLGNDLAFRLVGFSNGYPGFIDDPSRALQDINGTRYQGGRASLLYKPSSDFSIRLNASYQDRSWDDWSNVDVAPNTLTPLHGSLTQEHLIGQPGEVIGQVYNATINWDFGPATLLSATSYLNNRSHFLIDDSTQLGPAVSFVLNGAYGLAIDYSNPVHSFTEEVRVSSKDTDTIQWQIGGYFTNQNADENEALFPIDATRKVTLYGFTPNLGDFNIPVHYRELAGFANLDYHVTSTVDVSLGGRYSGNSQAFHEMGSGTFGGGANIATESSQDVFTYSGALRWHITPEHMLYARVAEGFVPGGPNDIIPTAQFPRSYLSSTTVNYEAGIKSDLLNHRLTLDLSGYHINWRRIQLEASVDGFTSLVNGGTAESNGAEWNVSWLPISGLKLNFNGAYTHANLTETTPASVGGQVGDRLPAVPLWETSVSADYERTLIGQWAGFAGVNWRFTGSRYADFEPASAGPRQNMPSFSIVDVRAGVENSRWSFQLFVRNLANKLAINYVQPETTNTNGESGPQSAVIYTPRTIGASVTARF
jgi:iron complex outermembrane receptor protein